MDLSNLTSAKSGKSVAELTLRHPMTNAPLVDEQSGGPMTISLVGLDSNEYQQVLRRNANARLRRASGGKQIKLTVEEIEADALEVLTACTKSWQNIVFNGKMLECEPVSIRQLYTDCRWIREQVDEFVTDRANFLGN